MAGVAPATVDAEMFSLIPKATRSEALKQMEPPFLLHRDDPRPADPHAPRRRLNPYQSRRLGKFVKILICPSRPSGGYLYSNSSSK
jgi:hypothetical protein